MTTRWAPSPDWKGETVAVLAPGPRMSAQIAETYRSHRTIVVNNAARVAPWADMLVAFDLGHEANRHLEGFAGMRVCAHESDVDALCMGHLPEIVQVGDRVVIVLNSGLGAVRLAAAMGAARIVLAGFEPQVPRRFDDDATGWNYDYPAIPEGLAKIVKELRQDGIEVEFDPRCSAEPGLSTAQPPGGPSIS